MTPLIQPHEWRVLEPLVDGALERDGAAREEFLSALDASTRAQVEGIVAECERLSTVLEAPAVDRFAALIAEESEPPAVLGDRYHIERVLGRGGMATVYLADDARHSRKVAVKVLSADAAALVTRERFLREIRIAAQLTHPHILSVHDSGETDGYLFYVMPYVDGESLRHRLHRERRLPVSDALAIASEVADALTHAHARGVIHRDIKPENVLLEGGHAVVADFGIARAIDAATDAHARADGIATGTPAYMSPEQATGGDVDRRSDLYSLACVLHEMLAGEPPFTDPDPHVIVRHHLMTEPRSVSALRPDTPAWVAAAIERALAKRADERFAEVAQFVEALKPSTATSSSVRSDTAPKPARLRRWSVVAAVATLSVLAALISIVSRRPPPAGTTRATPLTGSAAAAVRIDPRASDAYDNGVYYLARRTAEDRRRAVAELTTAVRLERRFAAAHARLADAYAAQGYFGYPGTATAAVAFARADSSIVVALAIDSLIPEVHLAIARLSWMHRPDLARAERAIHRALALDSLVAEAHWEHARIHAIQGRADSAIAAAERARALDRGSSVRAADVAWVYWIVRRYAAAVKAARATLVLDSTSSTAYLALGGGLMGLRRYQEAIAAFETGFRLSRGSSLFLPQLGHAYAAAGRTADARVILTQLRALHDSGRAGPYYVAQVYVGLDEYDTALSWLERAERDRSGHVVFLRGNAVWDPIRAHPRFRAIERRLGLQ